MDRVLSLDFETASLGDLKKMGASRYSRDPSLIVTVAAAAVDDEPVSHWLLPDKDKFRIYILGWLDEGYKIRAWNAFFEFCILKNYFGIDVKPEDMICTMQQALHAGLPGVLGDAGPALGLNIVKDTSAHGLMLRMCRPRKIHADGRLVWWHETDQGKFNALADYCMRDVEAERAIAEHIPQLPAHEAEISLLDRRANALGVRLDRDLIEKMIALAGEATRDLNAECAALTGGAVKSPGTETAKLSKWLESQGIHTPDVSKETVKELLTDDELCDGERRVLEIRQLAAKSSVKKLKAMLNCMDDDDCVRGVLAYYGASRTGRWAGRLIQPQNFPRPSIKDVKGAIDLIKQGTTAQGLLLFYGEPLEVIASCLRGTIIPREGKTFAVYDSSQIEARVLAWLAGQNDLLGVFGNGEDVYTYAAQRIGLNSRQEGKVAVLGLGYGMGPDRFIATAKTYGLTFTPQRSQEIVDGWRKANSKIVSLWYRTGDAIKDAVRAYEVSGGKLQEREINTLLSVRVNKSRSGTPLLTILLPSGRRLFYRDIEVSAEGDVSYAGVDQFTKRWSRIRSYGAKFVENITQAVARDVIADQALEALTCGDVLLSVHDELIVEVDGTGFAEEVRTAMNRAPKWAQGLPIAADGGRMDRYGK